MRAVCCAAVSRPECAFSRVEKSLPDFARCKAPRLPMEVFSDVHHLPDPVPVGDHYQPFSEVYGTATTEKHRPSLSSPQTSSSHAMPFPPSSKYAKNTMCTIVCAECSKPRLLYSKLSLKTPRREELCQVVGDLDYTCGSSFADIPTEEGNILQSVFVKASLSCSQPIEVPYYTAGHVDVCIHCGLPSELVYDEGCYPACTACKSASKKAVKKRARTSAKK